MFVYVVDKDNLSGKFHLNEGCHDAYGKHQLETAVRDGRMPCDKCVSGLCFVPKKKAPKAKKHIRPVAPAFKSKPSSKRVTVIVEDDEEVVHYKKIYHRFLEEHIATAPRSRQVGSGRLLLTGPSRGRVTSIEELDE